MIIYVGLDKNCEISYIMKFNFNYFDAHPSTWIWKVVYWSVILLDNICDKQCAISPHEWWKGKINRLIHKGIDQ